MNRFSSPLSLDHNDNCLVDNPLKDKLPEELDREAEIFAKKCNADKSLFKKAARIAQDPLDWSSVQGLTLAEEDALERELSIPFWHQPKTLKVTVVTLCFSAIIQGWVQTSINGANQTWPVQFGIANSATGQLLDSSSRWIFAGVNAITYLAASVFGCWLSDPLQGVVLGRSGPGKKKRALLGRRGAILISSCVCLAAIIGSACCNNWKQFIAVRALLGIGLGAKASITPVFGSEVSPPHMRGALVMNWQLFDTCGIFLSFTANLILYDIGPLSWRFQIASPFLPTLCLLTLIWVIPESPRWLLKQGRLEEAFQSMCQLRETPLQAAREIFYANAQLQIEVCLLPQKLKDEELKDMPAGAQHVEDANALSRSQTEIVSIELTQYQERVKLTSYWTRIWQLFRSPRTRRATVAAGIVMISQQLCGSNVLFFYSGTFFLDVGEIAVGDNTSDSRRRALLLSWGVGLANFLFTLPAYYGIEKTDGRPGGRRFLLLATYPGMTLTMLAACLSFLSSPGDGRLALVGLWLFLFVLFYSLGQGPVAFAYASEVYPLLNREVGMSFSVFINFLGAGLLTLFVPLSQATQNDGFQKAYQIQPNRLLAVFVGCNVLALILIFLFVPETAIAVIAKRHGQLISLSLEELNYIFGVPTFLHVRYQVFQMLPWGLRMTRWLIVDRYRGIERPRRPDKLYRWAKKRAKQRAETESSQAVKSGDSHLRNREALGYSRVFEMGEDI